MENKIALIIGFTHPNGVSENFCNNLKYGLLLWNLDVKIVYMNWSLPEQFKNINLSNVEMVLCLGPWPLEIMVEDKPLYLHLNCKYVVYCIDTPIYDFARFKQINNYIQYAKKEERLKIYFADKTYADIYQIYLDKHDKNVKIGYMPFAPFTSVASGEIEKKNKKIEKAVIVGGLGTELKVNGLDFFDTFEQIFENSASELAIDHNNIINIIDELDSLDFSGNVLKVILRNLNNKYEYLSNIKFLNLVCAVDSFVKKRNRVNIVKSIKNYPTDFYGPGWQKLFGNNENYNFKEQIKHFEIYNLFKQYKFCINFDPNWECGMHDRAYTAMAANTMLITNENMAISELNNEKRLVQTYRINEPNLIDILESSTNEKLSEEEKLDFIKHNSWASRTSKLISEIL